MSRLVRAMSLLALLGLVACGWLDRERLYQRCEIPLSDHRCPGADLDVVVGAAGDPAVDCELWLRGPLDGSGADTLAPSTLWAVVRREDDPSPEWICGDDVGQRVEIDLGLRASYSESTLVCPSSVDTCPSDLEDERARRCEVQGEVLELGRGAAVSAIVDTEAGPAVLWYATSTAADRWVPTVTWLETDGSRLAAGAQRQPCGETPSPEVLGMARGPMPPRQAASRRSKVLVADLCGEGRLQEIPPEGEVSSLSPEPREGSTAAALSVVETEAGDHLLLWSEGDRLLSTRLEADGEGLALSGQGTLVWSPIMNNRERPTAICRDGAGEQPECLLGWVRTSHDDLYFDSDIDRLLDGLTGQASWQLTGHGAGAEVTGELGLAQGLQLLPARSGGAGQRRGLALWRHPQQGILGTCWTFDDGTQPAFSTSRVGLGPGEVLPDASWTISRPVAVALSETAFLVAWWRRVGDDARALELRRVHLEEEHQGIIVAPIELPGLTPAPEGSLLEPPALAFGVAPAGETGDQGMVLVAWHDEDEASFVIDLVVLEEPFPADATRAPLFGATRQVVLEEGGGCEYLCAVDAVGLAGGFVVAHDLGGDDDGALSLLRVDSDGNLSAPVSFVRPDGLFGAGLSLWTGADPVADGEVWLLAASWFDWDLSWGELDDTVAGFGGAVFAVSSAGLTEGARDEALHQSAFESGRLGWQPTLVDSGGATPLVAWTEVEIPTALLLGDSAEEVLGMAEEDWDYWFDLDRTHLRLSQLQRVGDTLSRGASIDPELIISEERTPRVALGAELPCPELSPFDGAGCCLITLFGSMTPGDLDATGSSAIFGQRPPAGLALTALDPGGAMSSVAPGQPFYRDLFLLPTGLAVLRDGGASSTGAMALFSYLSLDPYSAEDHEVVVERLFGATGGLDPEPPETDWLQDFGGSQGRSLRAPAIHLAQPAVGEARFGVTWSRTDLDSEDLCFEASCPGEASSGEVRQEVLFAEVDERLSPLAPVVVLDRQPSPVAMEWYTYLDIDGIVELYPAIDLSRPLLDSSVLELGSGEYLAVWVAGEVCWSPDPEADPDEAICSPTQEGAVRARRIVCE